MNVKQYIQTNVLVHRSDVLTPFQFITTFYSVIDSQNGIGQTNLVHFQTLGLKILNCLGEFVDQGSKQPITNSKSVPFENIYLKLMG